MGQKTFRLVNIHLPSIGPIIDAMTKVAPKDPAKMLRFFNGVHCAMMMKLPPNIPAPANPWMARPMIKAIEDGAVAQTKLPISKMTIEDI